MHYGRARYSKFTIIDQLTSCAETTMLCRNNYDLTSCGFLTNNSVALVIVFMGTHRPSECEDRSKEENRRSPYMIENANDCEKFGLPVD